MASGGYYLSGVDSVGKTFVWWGYTNGFGNATLYVPAGIFTSPDTEARYNLRVPFACTASNMYVNAGTAPGTTHQIVFTLRSGASLGAMANTALTCTLTSAGVDASDVSHSVSLNAGDFISMQAVGSGTGSAEAYVKIVVQFTPA